MYVTGAIHCNGQAIYWTLAKGTNIFRSLSFLKFWLDFYTKRFLSKLFSLMGSQDEFDPGTRPITISRVLRAISDQRTNQQTK